MKAVAVFQYAQASVKKIVQCYNICEDPAVLIVSQAICGDKCIVNDILSFQILLKQALSAYNRTVI